MSSSATPSHSGADQSVDRAITATFSIPVTWFQSLNPLTVFALTPVFVARWTDWLRGIVRRPLVLKMVIGAVIIAMSYIAIAALAFWAQRQGHR